MQEAYRPPCSKFFGGGCGPTDGRTDKCENITFSSLQMGAVIMSKIVNLDTIQMFARFSLKKLSLAFGKYSEGNTHMVLLLS